MSPQPCYLKIQVNGQETFFLNEKIVAKYSGAIKKTIKQSKRRTQIKNSATDYIELTGFPGGPDGFELVSRFFHNNGRIRITVSNVSLLHCCALFLEMTENVSACNLLQQTEEFLEGMFYWSWSDVMSSLKSCEPFFEYADSKTGLVQKLVCALLAKIAQNSDSTLLANSSESSSSSPETASGFRLSSKNNTPESIKTRSLTKAWWFSELTILPPNIIERIVKTMGGFGFGTENNSLVLTKFLLHYLKTASSHHKRENYHFAPLADTAVHGVIQCKTSFSCRGLFWVLRVLSGLGLSRDCRLGLERLIGGVLDQATLDDLLVSGRDGGVYDVSLVLRLIRLFVHSDDGVSISAQKLKKVGTLVDKYLGEIAPDQNLKISKFLAVAESLPDSARSCFDGVYRAIDIYLESHPSRSFEERSRLCRCLNYKKLTLEACKDLAKNPRIPPRVAIQALMSQQPADEEAVTVSDECPKSNESQMVLYKGVEAGGSFSDENEDMRLNLQRMQWRVKQLEKVCRDMKGQMSKMVKHNFNASPSPTRALPLPLPLPRLC